MNKFVKLLNYGCIQFCSEQTYGTGFDKIVGHPSYKV